MLKNVEVSIILENVKDGESAEYVYSNSDVAVVYGNYYLNDNLLTYVIITDRHRKDKYVDVSVPFEMFRDNVEYFRNLIKEI